MPLDRIERKAVNLWFDRYSTAAPGNANHSLNLLGQILNHAKVHGHIETNPARGIRPNPVRKFNRFLSHDEISRLHAELDRCVAERSSRAVQADIICLLGSHARHSVIDRSEAPRPSAGFDDLALCPCCGPRSRSCR